MRKTAYFCFIFCFSLVIAACGGSDSDSSDARDSTAPIATALLPAPNATDVSLDTTLIVAFDEAIDPVSLGAGSFELFQGATTVASTFTHDQVNDLFVLTPDTALANDTTYTARVSAGITDLAGNNLAADFSWSFTTLALPPPVVDTVAPSATGVLPAIDETGVATSARVIVAFDEAIDPTSLTAGSFELFQGTTIVASTFSHDQVNNLFILTPAAPLANDTIYTARVSAGIADLAGNSLGADFSWSFTTLALPPPVVDTVAPSATGVLPAIDETGVDTAIRVIVAFDEAIDPASLTAASFELFEGTTEVASTFSHDQVNNLFILTPDATLAHEITYTARVSGAITDLAGNSLGADFSWSFTTRADNTVPQLLQLTPADGAIDVALDVVLSAQFDEPIDPASLTGFGITGVTGTASVSGDGSIIQFVPDQPLANLVTYEANLPATLQDLAGNLLNFAVSWNFTTLADLLPPQVVQTTPAEGAVIPIDQQQITIEFDEPIDPATVNTTNITATEAGLPFPINFVSLFPSNQVNISLPALSYDTAYTIELSTAITDQVGNVLAAPFVLSFAVEPDSVAPTITGRAPGIDGRVVPPDAVLQVQFSEPMDRNLVSPATVNIQGVSGIVSYDDATDTVSFIPDAALAPGLYTAQVSASLTDLAGNPLAGPESWTFSVDGAPLLLSDDSSAGHGPARVAFGGTDGFAVWSVSSGNGVKLVAARRNPSSTTFAVEQTIAEYPGDSSHLQPAIASNGTSFAVVWVRGSTRQIYASVFSGSAWSTPEVLGTAGGGVGRLGIVSNGSTYAAGWNNSFTYYASVFDGAGWTTATLGATSTTGSGVVGPLKLVSDGTGYAMAWVGRVSVYNGSSWSTSSVGSSNLEIAASNSGYAVSYLQNATTFPGLDWVYARVYNGTSWSSPVQLTGPADEGRDHNIASNGSSYAVITSSQFDSPTGDKRLQLFQFDGSSWNGTNLQTVAWNGPNFFFLQIASNGANYAVTWRDGVAGALLASVDLGAPVTLFAADIDRYDSFLVSGAGNYYVVKNDTAGNISARAYTTISTVWTSERAVNTLDSAAAQSLDVVVNGSGVLIGYGTDTADARLGTYSAFVSGTFIIVSSAERLLVSATHLGSVRNPVSAVNGAGDTMMVWEQFDGGAWQIRGRSYRNGLLDPVRIISATGQSPAIAADASSFMIVWEDNRQAFASRYTPATNTLTTATLLGAANLGDKPSVASNGSGFLAGWTDGRDVVVAEFTGTWGTSQTLYTDSSAFQENALVASANGDYAIIWIDDDFSSDALRGMVRSTGTWPTVPITLDSGTSITQLALLSNGSSYAAVYRDGANATARIYDAGAWGAPTNLGSGSPLAATDGSEYRVLFGTTTFDERVFSAGTWSDRIDSNLRPRAFASDGAGYAVLGEEIDGTNRTLYSLSRSATGWSLPLPIVTLTDDARFLSVALDGGAGLYRPLWTQPDSGEAIAQRLWFLPDN